MSDDLFVDFLDLPWDDFFLRFNEPVLIYPGDFINPEFWFEKLLGRFLYNFFAFDHWLTFNYYYIISLFSLFWFFKTNDLGLVGLWLFKYYFPKGYNINSVFYSNYYSNWIGELACLFLISSLSFSYIFLPIKFKFYF